MTSKDGVNRQRGIPQRSGTCPEVAHASETMYFNFASGDEDEELIRTTFGENYSRLVEVKNEYDPGNLFQLNTNIEPTV